MLYLVKISREQTALGVKRRINMPNEELEVLEQDLEKAKKKVRKARRAKRKKERQGFFADFKKFITRGNVVDMAVGVAVAAAFTAIVTAFTKGFVTPLLALLSGDKTTSELKWVVRPEKVELIEGVETVVQSEIAILYGAFLQAILDFLIIAFTLFLVMKIAGAIIKRTNKVMQGIKELTNEADAMAKAEAEAKAKEEAAAKEAAEKAAAEAAAAKAAEEAAKLEQMYKNISEQNELLRKIADAFEKK